MGYNGNNRGRTHNWSGVGNKQHYNWGLNLTARAMAAPFAILGALIELADIDTSTPKCTSYNNTKSINPPKQPPVQPHNLIKSLIGFYPELSQRITKLSEQKHELSSLKNKLKSVRWNFFLFWKRKRIINALNYKISRKEQFVTSFHIFEEDIIGKPIDRSQIKGKVTVLFFDQAKCNKFNEGIKLRKSFANFIKEINIIQSLSLKGDYWQMIFYNNGLLLEDNNHILYVPYKDIAVKETWIIHYADWDTHGYDIESSSWKYTRLDGGPDLRYSCNSQIHYIQRYQLELKFKKLEKDESLYLVFQKKEDSLFLRKKIAPRSRHVPEKIKNYNSRIF